MSRADIGKAERLLGYAPAIRLEDGLARSQRLRRRYGAPARDPGAAPLALARPVDRLAF